MAQLASALRLLPGFWQESITMDSYDKKTLTPVEVMQCPEVVELVKQFSWILKALDPRNGNGVLSEAVHTAWRKGPDCDEAIQIHKLITDMPQEYWESYLYTLEYMLHGAWPEIANSVLLFKELLPDKDKELAP